MIKDGRQLTYREKLLDPRWQKKKTTILERDGWRCCCCGATDKNLQVHHLVYSRCDPWDYDDSVFQTLCVDCHEERQHITDEIINAFRISLKNVPTPRLKTIAQRIYAYAIEEI